MKCGRAGCEAKALYEILIHCYPLQPACTEHVKEAMEDFGGGLLGRSIDPNTPWPDGIASVTYPNADGTPRLRSTEA